MPATIVYGPNAPKICLRMGKGGRQTYFSATNENLYLSYENDFVAGTFMAGKFLGDLCAKHCRPARYRAEPCPAFVESYMVSTDDNTKLATVELRARPEWERCLGARHVVDLCDTPDERNFLSMYLDTVAAGFERPVIADAWNSTWWNVSSGWPTRRDKFDTLMWATLRHPALIPQFWANWLGEASDEDRLLLDTHPSRVDFAALACGKRYVVEIDGLSHYNDFDGHGYKPNERTAARTLKYDRSMRMLGWEPIHIARIEVEEAWKTNQPWQVVSVLGFRSVGDMPEPPDLGVPELGTLFDREFSNDDLPF